jgi:hypothetical protein
LDVTSGCVYIYRDVVFDENVFPFASLHPNAGRRLTQDILLLPSSNNACTHGDTQFVDHMPLPVILVVTNLAQDNAPYTAEKDHDFEDHNGENLSENGEEMSANSSNGASEENDVGSGSEADSPTAPNSDGADPREDSPAPSQPVGTAAAEQQQHARVRQHPRAPAPLRVYSVAGLRRGARQQSMPRQLPLCSTGRRLDPCRHLVGPGPRQEIQYCMLVAALIPRRIFVSPLDLL